MALLEAMANGIPVLATAVGDIPFLIQDGLTGHLVCARDEEALEKGMIELLENPVRAKKMAETARRLVHEEFSQERMVELTEQLYQAIAADDISI